MTHQHHSPQPKAAKAPLSPYVEVTFLFRDVLQKPIAGLSVRLIAGAGAPPAPAWKYGPDSDDQPDALASATEGASIPAAGSLAQVPNKGEGTTDANGYLVTIRNAARDQPIDVQVKNRRAEYVWKATVKPRKDISVFTIVSPEYHLEATTKLTPTEEFEQELNLPVVKPGEVMTIERLVKEFGPYIGWSQKVTEQGKMRKDTPIRKKEVTEDEQTDKKKAKITIEHHYKVVDTGKPTTIAFNVLGSRLNYPKTTEISKSKFEAVARELKIEVAALKAVAATESSGAPFCNNGLPKIRYERHYFFRAIQDKSHWEDRDISNFPNLFPQYPDLCFPKMGGYSIGKSKGEDGGWGHEDGDVMYQYERLARAANLNLPASLMACSWGAFQVMGFFYYRMGYSTPMELAGKAMIGVDEQFDIFVAYMTKVSAGALDALQKRDWDKFARAYNGGGYPPAYPAQMEKYYNEFK
ncbi:N-acetylmuramidase family protein [Paraburkholderia largidicola]|uniref:N-acetylmuramidase domain-containing protein n=1 Tax=Paraburkholderia largidicola TaxID=3014751 RepID=A0A7I8BTE0_9BURK|nr:N-acetylmuramidase family protein [Paraburkholderia sp. PGU16]BCF91775.1 hypothetical protein PPGU16_48420 [Paraburkholderia sp. PGU16]